MDNLTLSIIIISAVFMLTTLYFFYNAVIQLIKGQRRLIKSGIRGLLGVIVSLPFLAGIAYCLYHIPDILFNGHSWYYVQINGPFSTIIAVISISTVVIVFYLYYIFTMFFVDPDEKPYFTIGVLSAVSGLGNGLIIYIINQLFARGRDVASQLIFYFIFGMLVYVFGQRLVRSKLITITNNLVYQKRMEIVNKILCTRFCHVERVGFERILTCLNNDTETVSGVVNMIITTITSFITILCCLVYMAFVDFVGFIISVFVIIGAAGVYYVTGVFANKVWEQTRSIQNVFFKYMNSLVNGFKELYMNPERKEEFKDDMGNTCDDYRTKRIHGDIMFANVFVIGELLFSIAVAVVIFLFPVIFKDIQDSTLSNFVFLFIYITGPVRIVLSTVPGLIQVRISWKRIDGLISDISFLDTAEAMDYVAPVKLNNCTSTVNMSVSGLKYRYGKEDTEGFMVGPIDFNIGSGEILFITGGNGSGKSTLAKLITGLYIPDEGEIRINGCALTGGELSKYYSAIFSDFYLFDKLYGIDTEVKSEEIDKYLKVLQLDEKVKIDTKKAFSTIQLSTGQRKRLAMLMSYLEDKQIYLFDEWAADQDPEFRKYFYHTLLPELKSRGKCIIAITHDDRYFAAANKIIKMEQGMIVERRADYVSA